MHRQSEGQGNNMSQENNDSDFKLDENFNEKKQIQNRLPYFLSKLSPQAMNLIQEYLEKNKQKDAARKRQERKITLYEDLTWIRQCKQNQQNLSNKKRSQAMQLICSKLSIYRSAVTIKERVQKMLSKLTNQQIINHIIRNEDFCFDNRKNLVDFQKKAQDKFNQKKQLPMAAKREINNCQIYESNDLPQKIQNPRPTFFTLRKDQEDSAPQKPFDTRKKPEGKQSIESKMDHLSIATQSFHTDTPEKMNARIISNQVKKQDLAQQILIVYNVEMGSIKCIKQMITAKSEMKPFQNNCAILSEVKQTINEDGTQKIQEEKQLSNSQLQSLPFKKITQSQQNFQEEQQKHAKIIEQSKQLITKLTDSENKNNATNEADKFRPCSIQFSENVTQKSISNSDKITPKSNTSEKISQNINNNEQLRRLRYKISNNELYLKLLNEDPKLSQQYIFQPQQDQALMKFIENTQEQTLTIKCMLRYKGLDLILQRIRFLDITANQKFLQAIYQMNGQKSEALSC